MNELEGFWAEADRRYSTELVARVRKATVTAAADVSSFSILLPGETTGRDGVASVSPIVPQVGDMVRLQLVGDQPVIVAVEQRDFRQTGTAAVVFTAANSATTTVTWPVPFTVAPTVLHAVQVGANNDVLSNLQSVTATQGTFRLFQKSGSVISTTATLHWEAIGV